MSPYKGIYKHKPMCKTANVPTPATPHQPLESTSNWYTIVQHHASAVLLNLTDTEMTAVGAWGTHKLHPEIPENQKPGIHRQAEGGACCAGEASAWRGPVRYMRVTKTRLDNAGLPEPAGPLILFMGHSSSVCADLVNPCQHATYMLYSGSNPILNAGIWTPAASATHPVLSL